MDDRILKAIRLSASVGVPCTLTPDQCQTLIDELSAQAAEIARLKIAYETLHTLINDVY